MNQSNAALHDGVVIIENGKFVGKAGAGAFVKRSSRT